MSGNSYLLDTNIIIAALGGEKDVIDNIHAAKRIFIPSIVVGELYFGAFKSAKQDQNIYRIKQLIGESVILACDEASAFFYGQIKNELKAKGSPIPENDIWIAAIAFQYDIQLVSRDKHFSNIDQVNHIVW